MVETEPGTEHIVVTFRLPNIEGGERAHVVGEFNDWSRTAHPMVRDDEGFTAQIALEPGRAYRFRYLLDGERWENDWAADAYVPNEFGGDDSVVDLTEARLQKPKRVRKAAAPPAEAPGGDKPVRRRATKAPADANGSAAAPKRVTRSTAP